MKVESLLRVDDVAKLLSCSRRFVYQLVAEGELTCISIGCGAQRSMMRWRSADVQDFIERHVKKAAP